MRAVNEGKHPRAMTKHSRYKCHTTQEAIKINKCAGDFTKCSESQENKEGRRRKKDSKTLYRPFSYKVNSTISQAVEVEIASSRSNGSMGRETLGQVASSVVGLGVIETLVQGLEEEHAVAALDTDGIEKSFAQASVNVHVAYDDRRGKQDNEEDQHDEVEDGETNHTSLTQLGLLQRVDGGTDLATVSMLLEAMLWVRKNWAKHTWGAARTE